ncbi:cysteine desulfurase NifS [Candidatus Woesearchaeota archaeon]|nr:cysteine desulfurase NifS [Candidatus Woesearchaeota archaeon]
MKAYLDNGATTMVDPDVVEVMMPYFSIKYGNAGSLHGLGKDAGDAVRKARATIAEAINADPDEIIFTSGGTESDNIALKEAAFANQGKGNHIITTKIEHPAVLETCRFLETMGFSVTYLDVDKEGFVDVEAFRRALRPETILASVMHANNEIGTIEPISEIGSICREKGIIFHTDAVQSFTKVPIDTKAMNIDLMSLSAHKIHGPKGTGALFVRKGTKLGTLMHGGGQEKRLRSGTENVPGIVGFAKAVEIAAKSHEHIARMTGLRDRLGSGLLAIPGSSLNGAEPESGKRLCNNINVSFKYVEGEAMLVHLDLAGVAVSTGSACSQKSLKPSHVLLAIGMARKDSHGTLRLTLSRFTTEEEVDYTVEALKGIVEKLREMSPLNKETIKGYDDIDLKKRGR